MTNVAAINIRNEDLTPEESRVRGDAASGAA